MSIRTLKKTILEKHADFTKDEAPGLDLDLPKVLEEKVKTDTREGSALARSTKIRKSCEYLPEDAVKIRKAYFCNEK